MPDARCCQATWWNMNPRNVRTEETRDPDTCLNIQGGWGALLCHILLPSKSKLNRQWSLHCYILATLYLLSIFVSWGHLASMGNRWKNNAFLDYVKHCICEFYRLTRPRLPQHLRPPQRGARGEGGGRSPGMDGDHCCFRSRISKWNANLDELGLFVFGALRFVMQTATKRVEFFSFATSSSVSFCSGPVL